LPFQDIGFLLLRGLIRTWAVQSAGDTRSERVAECGMLGDIVGGITDLETIALGHAIRDLPRLQKLYGKGRWRKMKGRALMGSTRGVALV